MYRSISEIGIMEKKSGFNCIQLSISNILGFYEYPLADTVWKQCGLALSEKDGMATLLSSYMDEEEELRLLHQIHSEILVINNAADFTEQLKQLLDCNTPVIVIVDTFHLPKNMYYHTTHLGHTIILNGYDDQHFFYVDDAYRLQDKILFEDLVVAAKDDSGNYRYHYMDLSQAVPQLSNDNYEHIIRLNYEHLCPKDGPTAIQAIEEFYSFYEKFSEHGSSDASLYEFLYEALVEVSNAHYHFSRILAEAAQYDDSLLEPSELFARLGQDWRVSGNMMLKNMMTVQMNMFPRMLNKVKGIAVLERQALDSLERRNSKSCLR